MKTLSKQKWNYKIINRKKSLPFNDQENLLVSFYDIIMELKELSKLSEDYIAGMLTKLGLNLVHKLGSEKLSEIKPPFI